jgi:hypothetical protein
MHSNYHDLGLDDNAQVEFAFNVDDDDRPTRRAVDRLAKRASISEPHARAALSANGSHHD